MLSRILTKGKSIYIPLPKDPENNDEIDPPITRYNQRKQWHPDLWSALIGFITAIFIGVLGSFLSSKINATTENKLQQLVHIPVETVVFRRNQTFIKPPSKDSDRAWESLIPGVSRGHGFIAIEHPEQYGLLLGKQSGPYTQNFGVSMYHQLHCLISIRDIFWGLLNKKYNASDYHFQQPSGLDTNLTMRVDLHTNHCFDYLRQGIMCAGDMSIEGVENSQRNGGGEAVTEWGMKHRECINWDAATKFMEAHQPV